MSSARGDVVVAVNGASVGYGGRPILTDINLTVRRGEVVAILGANGSGKSTLIRAILGLTPPRSGTVTLFDDSDAARPGLVRRGRQRVGYVPQRLGAGSGVPATVGEVVASGRLGRRWLRPAGDADRAAVVAAIAAVGLSDRIADPVGSLSGGQQQRTLIARALAAEPELLVLDEPTAGVDAASQEAFAKALDSFVAGGGTVLLVAHELGPLQPLITRAIVIHGGAIRHDGAIPEPAGHHALPGHDHVHPHAPAEGSDIWWGGK
jgi:zinc transport system ATP-binding protein